jgi:molybdenum cofactor cytidylyltransferase
MRTGNGISAVILAAGLSRRMGTPKMLLPWGETTVLGQVVATYTQAGVGEIVVVTGGARQQVEAEVTRLAASMPLCAVFNPQHEEGDMLSSLQCGLAALDGQTDAVLIGLGDQPQLSPAALQLILAALAENIAQLFVPSFEMHRGHPWLVRRGLWDDILTMQAPQTMRDFLNKHAGQIFYIQTDHTILKDLDTPDQYKRERP